MAAIFVICGVVCCCSSIAGALFAFPIPGNHLIDKQYDEFTEIVTGRSPLDQKGKAFSLGQEQACVDNCSVDFTCKAFALWNKNGSTWCLKMTDRPNKWATLPDGLINRTGSKIYIKNN